MYTRERERDTCGGRGAEIEGKEESVHLIISTIAIDDDDDDDDDDGP